jgi:hypothetical protein
MNLKAINYKLKFKTQCASVFKPLLYDSHNFKERDFGTA